VPFESPAAAPGQFCADPSSPLSFRELLAIVFREWPVLEEAHRNGARLRAYRKRHHWRKADVVRLLNLGVNKAAQQRMARMLQSKSPGRGVVIPYIPLCESILIWARQFQEFGAPATHPNIRLAFLKSTPWWPNFIEMMYRAELAVLQQDRRRHVQEFGREKPSELAECAVSEVVGLSPASVHALCRRVRHERKHGPPKDPALPVSEFKRVLATGDNFRVSETP
jgi:hypothetical protein